MSTGNLAVKAIVFDVDGTLADTEEVHRQALNPPPENGPLRRAAGGRSRASSPRHGAPHARGEGCFDTLLDLNLNADWRRWFTVIETGDSVPDKKPSPAVYQAVLRGLGLRRHRRHPERPARGAGSRLMHGGHHASVHARAFISGCGSGRGRPGRARSSTQDPARRVIRGAVRDRGGARAPGRRKDRALSSLI